MENKINVAELLRNCPPGMELNCTMYDNVYFDRIDENDAYPIRCYVLHDGGKESISFTSFGTYAINKIAKCVIFPKGETTWVDFRRPFQNGEIIIDEDNCICIFKREGNLERTIDFYCGVAYDGEFIIKDINDSDSHFGDIFDFHLATEEEKQKLFDAIKENGYHWNAETKTLEKLIKPKFKIGDKIKYNNGRNKDGIKEGIILMITDYSYDIAVTNDIGSSILIADQDNWELIPNKFDINTLVLFESKVLVRDFDNQIWRPAIFGGYIANKRYYVTVGGLSFKQLIPYEGNEHLCNKNYNCSIYYNTWEE